jgi:hypothetical protein
MTSIGLQAQSIVTGSNLNIGSDNTLTNNLGNVIGNNNIINSPGALAVGLCDTIETYSRYSVTLGEYNKAGGIVAMAFGNNVKVTGDFSMGMGRYLKTTGDFSITLGNGIAGTGNRPNLFFENNNYYSLVVGFNSTKPTLTVGPSPNDYPNGNLIYNRTGKVAIGDVPVPEIAAKLHIRSDEGEDAGIFMEPKDLEHSSVFIKMRDEGHGIEVDNNGIMRIKSKAGYANTKLLLQGHVGINIANLNSMNSSYSLCVRGGILTDKINIKHINHWPDYVFSSDYLLMPLADLKAFVTENHHLPEVPSENDIMSEGIEIGEMQGILLKKIEEMTLYILQQQEQIDKLEQRINELEGN